MIVLNYHHVHDEDENFFRVTTKQFERQMQYILDCGYTFVTLDQFLERPDAPASVLVTFDDGYEDVYYNAAPILERMKIPAVMFLIAGYIGKWNDWDAHVAPSRRRHLSLDQVHAIMRQRWEIGCHSLTHPDLRLHPAKKLVEELVYSKKLIERLCATRVRAFAYPGGHSDEILRRKTLEHYDVAFSIDPENSTNCAFGRFDVGQVNWHRHLHRQGSWGFLGIGPHQVG